MRMNLPKIDVDALKRMFGIYDDLDDEVPDLKSFNSDTVSLDWDEDNRRAHVRTKSWFVLTDYTVDTLVHLLGSDSTVEVFSGTGLLNYYLKKRRPIRTITKAYDNRSYGARGDAGWAKYARPYSGSKKNCFMVPIRKFDSVIMTWPSYDVNHGYRIIRKMKPGQKLYYQGEGPGGCCADDQFFEYLDTHFSKLEGPTDLLNHQIARYSGLKDKWTVYVKAL